MIPSRLAMAALAGVICVPALAHAQLGNVPYTQAELGKALSMFKVSADGPPGVDAVMMLHGRLLVLGTNDSGAPPGVWHVYDVGDPRNPKLLKTFSSPTTKNQREMHMATWSKVNGKDVLVAPTITGIAFFDFTDVMNPADVSALTLTGVNGGDYTNVAWHSSYSWPYVFTGSSGSGVNITDATDPAKPVLIKTFPVGSLGNFRVGPVYAAGNYLVVSNMDQAPFRASVIDVSDARNPQLLTTVSSPNGQYSTLVMGDLMYGGGEGANYNFFSWSPTGIKTLATTKIGTDKGGYCTQQDNFAFCGQSSDGFHKIDITDPSKPTVAFTGSLGSAAPGGDFDFATVIGNLLFEGDDHPSGAGFIPHQLAPDTTPPKVFKVYPEDQATKQPLSTRVTVFFTDEIDWDTVGPASVFLRKNGAASPLDFVLSHSSTNAISIGPKQSLEANTTYEVVVAGGGVKDLAGNAIGAQTISRFSTGATLGPPIDGGGMDAGPLIDASNGSGTGGAGNTGGAGGTGGSSGGASGGNAGSGGDSGSGGAGPITSGVGVGGGDTSAGVGGSGVGGTSGAGVDGGTHHDPATETGGCGCTLPGRAGARGLLSLFAAALGMGIGRIRARRRR
jgi:hypothetical protein